MVTSTNTPTQRLVGYYKSGPYTPTQSPRAKKSGQFNKSPSPAKFTQGKKNKEGLSATPTTKKVSMTHCRSR